MIAIDVGNTKIALGYFRQGKLVAQRRIGTDARRSADEYEKILAEFLAEENESFASAGHLMICSVVPHVTEEFRPLGAKIDMHVVSHQTPRSFEICIAEPASLGADRIADLEAAICKYGAPVIVVDAGTATTVSAINEKREFIGGAIAPGFGISAEALFARAAQLPEISLATPTHAIGQTTDHAIHSGVYFGHAALIEGLIEKIASELTSSSVPVVASGGAIEVIQPFLPREIIFDRNLTLEGLTFLAKNLHAGESRHG